MNRKHLIAGAIIAAALVACGPKPNPPPVASARPPAVTPPSIPIVKLPGPMSPFDINPQQMKDCSEFGSLDYVSDINIEISRVDPYNPTVTFQRLVHSANTQLPINSGEKAGHTPPTQFDFELGYEGGPATKQNKKSAASITITVSDDNVDIRTEPKDNKGNPTWAVTASGDNGPKMFCGPAIYRSTTDANGTQRKSINFTGIYDTNDPKTYGSFNLGLIAHNSPYALPIFIGPNVKNNG